MIVRTTNGVREALALTPVLREFKRRFPEEKVTVETIHPELFMNNPFVDRAVEFGPGGDLVNLDMYSAVSDNTHFVDQFARVILGDTRMASRAYEVFLMPHEIEEGKKAVNVLEQHAVAVSFDKDFHTDREVLDGVVGQLDELGYDVFILDSNLSLRKTLAIINNCKLFVGLDDDISYMAMASKVPMVMGFSYRNPEAVRPYRRGIPFAPVVAPESRCKMVKFCESQNVIREFGVTYGLHCPNEDKFICARHTLEQWSDAIEMVMVE
jgi:ADP-heptose:LPS heptosyltransferase